MRTEQYNSTYRIWAAMKTRCDNSNHENFHRYGGRGIKYCARWNKFKGFLEDMGLRPGNLTLDRIDNEKGYSKKNCRWATREVQGLNKTHRQGLSGLKYISIKRKGIYFQITRKSLKVNKCFQDLDEAIKYRDNFLSGIN